VTEKEREDLKTRGDYASYDTWTELRKWANRNKVFKVL